MFVEKNPKTITLTAVGDILMHGRVYGGLSKKSGFKFKEQLKNVEGILGKSDITIANLESIIGGVELGLSGFPRFNGPVEIGYALKDLGVDIVTIANNHVLDHGEIGLLKSIANLEKIGLEYDGAYKSQEDKDRLRILERNGLKIAFVSYTKGTNGIRIPKDKKYMVNSLVNTSVLKVAKEIRTIRNNKFADIIIVNLHYGDEYFLEPSVRQKEIATSLANAGADVILGHHPHVLQPPEWIETSHGTRVFAAYSLGNFFSGQNGLYRQIGAALTLEVTKPHEDYKGVTIKNPKYELTYVNRESRLRYDMYLLRDWVSKNKYIKTTTGNFDSRTVYEDVKNRLRSNIPDLEVI